jgi:hypothetical protein
MAEIPQTPEAAAPAGIANPSTVLPHPAPH